MQKQILNLSLIALLSLSVLSSCKKEDDETTTDPAVTVTVPTQLSVNKTAFIPEDVLVYQNKVYVSGLGNGTIQQFDLTQASASAVEVVATDTDRPSRWGLAVDESKQTLLNIANVNYAFNGSVSGPAKVFAYKLSDHSIVTSWTLPANTVGNAIVVANGFYYISDIGPNTRIIRLNPNTGEIVIKTDALLPSNGFGFGNIIYANNGLYGSVNGKMYHIVLEANGNFGAVSEVTGLSNVQTDGMTWAGNNTFYYAYNDALDPSNAGKVWKVSLTSNTIATQTLATEVANNGSLNNPSGVFYTMLNNKKYLFVNESQLLSTTMAAPFKTYIVEIR
jgi:hypothetical protein